VCVHDVNVCACACVFACVCVVRACMSCVFVYVWILGMCVCVRACGLTPQCPSFVLIIPHLLSVVGHQLHSLWCPWSHLWYSCIQLVRSSAGNGNECCLYPLRGRHSKGILKVTAPIVILSCAEILQRSVYIAIGAATNLYMCMKASLQLCPFQS